MYAILLSRDEFRERVFARDRNTCVYCGRPGVDAHHIIERRLFPDGGYYLSNGVTLCSDCHLAAESTTLDCETLRRRAGINETVLPPHFYMGEKYDKWGNPILANGLRLRGELFDEKSVQKALRPVLHLFTNRVKYPRTYHLPWSPGASDDDKIHESTDQWNGMEVVVTEKMDGENTTMYRDYMHARSLDYEPHPSRSFVKALWSQVCFDIPDGWRVCGENLTAKHSIKYTDLRSRFLVFSIWNERNICLSWDETVEYSALLDLFPTPLLYRGVWDETLMQGLAGKLDLTRHEGYVVRPAGEFHFKEFSRLVGKYVRKGHVETDEHWMHGPLEYNEVKNG